MDYLFKVDWSKLLVPKLSVLEIIIRGVVIYTVLCLLLRVVLKRQAGKVGLSDLLVVTLVAGVCRNPLVADAYSLTDGIGVVAVVLACSYGFDWLSYHSRFIHRITHPEPVQLIRDGEVLTENLRHELMTEGQLCCQLRQAGVASPAEVAGAWMEGSGGVSVMKKGAAPGGSEAPATCSLVATVDTNDEPDLRLFEEAARRLEARLRWHQERVAQLKAALSRRPRNRQSAHSIPATEGRNGNHSTH